MLNGIGGKSVAEAKRTLSYAEALRWFAYVRKHGTPNLHLHQGFAMIATQINNALGGKAQMSDFMLGEQKAEAAQVATDKEVIALLMGLAS